MNTRKNINIVVYIIVSISCIFIGCILMYGLIYFFPNTIIETINKVEREVTVNDKGISDGIEAIYDSVVVIENYQVNKLTGIGSGFVYDKTGLIITNNHVVDGATELKVILSNGKNVKASIVGTDEYADIAVIKIDEKEVISVAKIGKSEETKLGDTVFAIGSPMSSNYAGTVTRGIISGKNRMVEVSVGNTSTSDWIMNVMQTDAAINPGNSGGPLCNVSGEVIGVNNMKIVESSVEGIGFAIPIEDAIEWANKLVSGEETKRSYLGIEMTDINSTTLYYLFREGIEIDDSITAGVIVNNVLKDSPSDKAGIEKGDVIVGLEDYKIDSVAELRYYLYKYEPNSQIKIKLIRKDKEKNVKVTLGTAE